MSDAFALNDAFATALLRAATMLAGVLVALLATRGRGGGALIASLCVVLVFELVRAHAPTGWVPTICGGALLALVAWRLAEVGPSRRSQAGWRAHTGLTTGRLLQDWLSWGAVLVGSVGALGLAALLPGGGGLAFGTVLAVALAPALATEFAYRGAVYALISPRLGGPLAVALSALPMAAGGIAVVGGEVLLLKAALAVGVVVSLGLSVLRWRSGSLLASGVVACVAAVAPLVV